MMMETPDRTGQWWPASSALGGRRRQNERPCSMAGGGFSLTRRKSQRRSPRWTGKKVRKKEEGQVKIHLEIYKSPRTLCTFYDRHLRQFRDCKSTEQITHIKKPSSFTKIIRFIEEKSTIKWQYYRNFSNFTNRLHFFSLFHGSVSSMQLYTDFVFRLQSQVF